MVMPFYSDNSECFNFSHIAPVGRDMFALYIHSDIALLFKDIWDVTNNSKFIVGDVLESSEDLDCNNFDKRLSDFSPYRKARVSRTLEGSRDSIFFDAEEVDILEGLFNKYNFTAIVSVYVRGKEYEVDKVDKHIYNIIKPFIENFELAEMIDCDEYRKAYSHSRKEVRAMFNKMESWKNVLPGLLLTATGIALTVAGYNKNLGLNVEVSTTDESAHDAPDVVAQK